MCHSAMVYVAMRGEKALAEALVKIRSYHTALIGEGHAQRVRGFALE